MRSLLKNIALFFCLNLICTNISFAQGYLSYSELIGGESSSSIIAIEKDGFLYRAMNIRMPISPISPLNTTDGTQYIGENDVFVEKIHLATKEVVFSTFIGYSNEEYVNSLNILDGELYIVGATNSSDFLITNNTSYTEGVEANVFLRKLDINTGAVLMSGLYGPTEFLLIDFDAVFEINKSGDELYLMLTAMGSPTILLPHTSGANPPTSGFNHLLYLRLNASSGNILTISYSSDRIFWYKSGNKMYVKGNKVYVIESTYRNNFITTGGYEAQGDGLWSLKVFDRVTGALIMSRPYSPSDALSGIYTQAIAKSSYLIGDNLYVFGTTTGLGYPVTTGLQPNNVSNKTDIFFTVIDINTGDVLFSNLYGGVGNDYNIETLLDGKGNVYLTFNTENKNLYTHDGSVGASDIVLNTYLTRVNLYTGVQDRGIYLNSINNLQIESIKMFCDHVYVFGKMNNTFGDIKIPHTYYDVNYGKGLFYQAFDEDLKLVDGTYWGGTTYTSNNHMFVDTNGVHLIGVTRDSWLYPNTEIKYYNSSNSYFWTQFESLDNSKFHVNDDTLNIHYQEVCQLGNINALKGIDITVESEDLPLIYIYYNPYEQSQRSAKYIWQIASFADGPWTDIPLSNSKIYKPSPIGSDKFFRRVAYVENPCNAEKDTISISNISHVHVTSGIAPMIDGGVLRNTCPGSLVNLGGYPSIVSGNGPFEYKWFLGRDSSNVIFDVPNPQVTAYSSEIYTLYVTDVNGCTSVTQTEVFVHQVNAGSDVYYCGGEEVKLKSSPIPGLNGVTYGWFPTDGLSCTDCFSPYANPAETIEYIYSISIPQDTGSCVMSDTVKVIVANPPRENFAGEDIIICHNPSSNVKIGLPSYMNISNVYQSSIGLSGTPESLSDNVFSTGYRTNTGANQWIIIDLGEIKEYILRLEYAASSSITNLNGTTIEASSDSINWQFVRNITSSSVSSLSSMQVNLSNIRYIKLSKASGIIGVSEFRVYDGFQYKWTPDIRLSNPNVSETNYIQEPNFPLIIHANPMIYTLTASFHDCVFNDSVLIEVINANVGLEGCGPRKLGGNTDDSNLEESFYWEVVSGGGMIIGPSDVPNPNVSESPAGQPTLYRLTTSYKGQICTDEVLVPDCGCEVNIVKSSSSSCGVAFVNNPVVLTAYSSGLGDSLIYEWTPQIGLSNYSSKVVTFIDTISRVYLLTVRSAIDTSLFCTQNVIVDYSNSQKPNISLEDKIICEGSVQIGSSELTGYSFAWTPSSTLDFSNAPNPIASPEKTTTYYLTMTNDSSGCTIKDTVTVFVRSVKANAGEDLEVCLNSIVKIGEPPLNSNSIRYTWRPDAPWQNGTDSSFAQPEVLVANNLIFFLHVYDSITGCEDWDTIEIKIINKTEELVPAEDLNICKGSSSKIGNVSKPGLLYSWTPSTGLSNTNIAQPIASPDTTTTYILQVNSLGCGAVFDTVVVNVVDLELDLQDIYYCPSAGSVNLGVDVPISGITNYIWSPSEIVSNPIIANPTTLNPPPASATDFILTVKDNYGCTYRDTLTIIPNASIPNAGSSRNLCLGSSTRLGSLNNGAGNGIQYSWSPSTGLSCVDCIQPEFTPTSAGVYEFKLQKEVDGCVYTDQVIVNVIDFQLTAISNKTICRNSCVNIGNETAIGGVSYSWSPSTGLSSVTSHNPVACLQNESMTYALTATSSNGCTDTKSVIVNVTDASKPEVSMNNTLIVNELPVTIQLNPMVSPNGNYSYNWSPNDFSISNSKILNPVFTIFSAPKNYTLEIIDQSNGCASSETVTILFNHSVLPVTLLDFNVILKNEKVHLFWQTASELNNDFFEIEKSSDVVNWDVIGSVSGNGTSNHINNYTFIDSEPFIGIGYYRLRQVDYDGNFSYSPIRDIVITNTIDNTKVKWFPNPTSGEIIFNSFDKKINQLVITDMLGRIVQLIDINNIGEQRVFFNNLVKGAYVIHFLGDNFLQVDKIFVK